MKPSFGAFFLPGLDLHASPHEIVAWAGEPEDRGRHGEHAISFVYASGGVEIWFENGRLFHVALYHGKSSVPDFEWPAALKNADVLPRKMPRPELERWLSGCGFQWRVGQGEVEAILVDEASIYFDEGMLYAIFLRPLD